ncbi:winged helix-turn-helix domain-containing protein [Streptomyces liangshanensis]|uniref:Winged helix-turn-helix transcriptional regulator n=1 Tax=Streptomyces liangshanensis TaxID=2717324 RepID=A0A6G9GRM1_9ACTN|nr:winged helix-turn-helix domain-containing protein [Streptomyces liangshanensis]QIQ00903.1 winged helix-turn-helix transcriptional regulator [Streptomyces liangshanensis]
MLRIHFTSEDIGRVRVAAGPVPAWEMLLSLHVLRGRADHGVFEPWRAGALGCLDASSRPLLALAPPKGYSPDFLTPCDTDVESGVEAVRSTPRARLRKDITLLAGPGAAAGGLRPLADGDVGALGRLGEAMRTYHDRALAPVWDRLHTVISAERAARAADLLDGGVERLLSRLHPLVRWQAPVLSVAYPVRRDLRLGGRGLLLVPSYFCWARPIALRDAELEPVLVYPANRGLERLVEPAGDSRGDGLARLLGATRAAVLEEIATTGGVTGTDVARRLRISPASASEHATVLRHTGLITSHRTANTVLHMPTPLGRAVLDRRTLTPRLR